MSSLPLSSNIRLLASLHRTDTAPKQEAGCISQVSRGHDIGAGTTVGMLDADEMEAAVEHAAAFNLDFDDAYQYAVAEKYDLTIVSFDKDFDRTTRGRREPSAIA